MTFVFRRDDGTSHAAYRARPEGWDWRAVCDDQPVDTMLGGCDVDCPICQAIEVLEGR